MSEKAISVRIPVKLADTLDWIVKESKRSHSFIVQKALESYIGDYADLQVALDRLRDKTDPLVTSKEMRKSFSQCATAGRGFM